MMESLMRDFRFYSLFDGYLEQDRMELMKKFTLNKVKAGYRFYNGLVERGDAFHLIVRGQVAILFPDTETIS
jgi:hypothetical protein